MHDTQRTPDPARRGFLRGAVQSAVAAAAALFLHPAPAAAVVAPARPDQTAPIPLRPEPAHIHAAGGLHEKFRIPESDGYLTLLRRFGDSLTAEQREMYSELDVISGVYHTAP